MNPIQRSLVILKPDAMERGVVGDIRSSLESFGLTVVNEGYVKLNLQLVQEFYQWSHLENSAAIEDYLCHRPLPIWLIEGDDALAKTLFVRNDLRRRLQTVRLKNLLHCSANSIEFEWQLTLLRKKNLIMKEVKTPNQVQVIVFRCTDSGETEFLMLKRNEQKGGFWQSVTGNVKPEESFEQAAVREVGEELKIQACNPLVDINFTFDFTEKGVKMTEKVFGLMVPNDQQIVLSEEHTEFAWVSKKQALENYLKYPGNKEGVTRLAAKIQPDASEEGKRS